MRDSDGSVAEKLPSPPTRTKATSTKRQHAVAASAKGILLQLKTIKSIHFVSLEDSMAAARAIKKKKIGLKMLVAFGEGYVFSIIMVARGGGGSVRIVCERRTV